MVEVTTSGQSSADSTAITSEMRLAHRLADAADSISLARYLALDLVVETKPDATPVTDADRAVEKSIRMILEAERPSDLIIGEEFGGSDLLASAVAGRGFWIIDPIDGTKNFLRGVPTWATLIGYGHINSDGSKSIDLGVVSSPALGRRWWAERGAGAYLTENFASASPLAVTNSESQYSKSQDSKGAPISVNTRRIRVSKVASLADASLSYSDLIGWEDRKEAFISLLNEAWRTRALGDFLSHMLVAEGAVDIAAEPSLALWDMAALAVIVEEAGGRFSALDGIDGPFGRSGLSTNRLLHEEVLHHLNGVGPG
jgi:histidinol-phosphatase